MCSVLIKKLLKIYHEEGDIEVLYDSDGDHCLQFLAHPKVEVANDEWDLSGVTDEQVKIGDTVITL